MDYIIHFATMLMPPRATKKAATNLSQPLPKTAQPPQNKEQQQIQCKIHTNTHAVLLGLGALLVLSFGLSLSSLAASKKTEPTIATVGSNVQALEAKIDKLQRQLDSVSAQLLKACNDVSNSCLEKASQADEETTESTDGEKPDEKTEKTAPTTKK
ncbi:MAG: hypothetical protein AAB400_02085 [Patescibacteria group bacterium]